MKNLILYNKLLNINKFKVIVIQTTQTKIKKNAKIKQKSLT